MAEEKYNLKFGNFHTNISKSLKDIRFEDDFSDVTLVGDDNQQIHAHKVILSTCSQYFKKVLKMNKHPNPLLCLWGLNANDLKHILDYIYFGEVQLLQEELNRFLDVAKKLELDGAAQAQQQESNLNEELEESYNVEEFCMITEEQAFKNDTSLVAPKDEPPILFLADPENLAELDQLVSESYSRNENNLYQCHHCPKKFSSTSHAKDHVEIHIDGTKFPCKYCGRYYKTRHQRRAHESKERKTFLSTRTLLK